MMHLMESCFDLAYLGLVIGLGLRILLEKSKPAKSFGLMAIILGVGDAFHLLPRVLSQLTPDGFAKYEAARSWGLLVTSITMTIFYILFYYYYRGRSQDRSEGKRKLIYLLAALRLILLVLPQNAWGTEGVYGMSLLRNVPFTLMGILLIVWTYQHRDKAGLEHVCWLIAASFLFYLIVVVGAPFVPALGAFMIPKTLAYIFLVVSGYRYFIQDFGPENILKAANVFLWLGLVGGVFYREFTKYFAWTDRTSLRVVHVHLIALGCLFLSLLYLLVRLGRGQGKQGQAGSFTQVGNLNQTGSLTQENPLTQAENLVTQSTRPNLDLSAWKKPFFYFVTGLSWTVTAFMVRGIYTICAQGVALFPDGALSGLAGVGHVLLGIGLVWLSLKALKENLPVEAEGR